jgi:hypothetical protein
LQSRYTGLVLALFVACALSFSLVAGAFADRGGNHGGHGDSHPSVGTGFPGSNGSSKANDHSTKHGSVATDDDNTPTPTAAPATNTPTGTSPTATPTEAAEKHPENHGDDVSDVAHSAPKGPEHGEEVSEVARRLTGADDDDLTVTPTGTPPTATATGVVTETVTVTATPTSSPTPGGPTETATATPTDSPTPGGPTTTVTATQTPDDNDADNATNDQDESAVGSVLTRVVHSVEQLLGVA